MSRALSVAEQVGMHLLFVHTVKDEAWAFYEHFGFEVSPTDSMNLRLLRTTEKGPVRGPLVPKDVPPDH